MLSTREKRIAFLIIILMAVLFRLPAFFQPHQENDEVIYQTLIKKTTFKLKDYTLQGTEILEKLPKINYDYPVFHHPPLFIYLSAVIEKTLGINWLILLPIFSSLLTIWVTFKIGERLYDSQKGLISAAILAICPVSLFASTKIWLDSLLALLITLSIYFSLKAKRLPTFILAGLAFTGALMTKYSALFILPTILLIILKNLRNWVERITSLIYFWLPLILTFPWFIFNYQKMGVLFHNERITAEGINMFPFLFLVSKRPIYFYLIQTLILCPLCGLSLIKIGKLSFWKKNLILICWLLIFLAGLTIYGFIGGSYQMRYILPLFPALSILTAASLPQKFNDFHLICLILIFIYALLTGILNSYVFLTADLFPFLGV